MFEYDLTISPVHWRDRGSWKCQVEDSRGESKQSVEGSLDVEVPLKSVAIRSDDDSGALVVDEHDEVQIICRTSPATPAPENLRIYIGNELLNNVQVQISTLGDEMKQVIGTVRVKNVVRNVNDKLVRCVAEWRGRDQSSVGVVVKEGRARLNVFFPPEQIRIETRQVKWNELLVAKCIAGIAGNPTPQFEWKLAGRFVGTGSEIEIKVDKKDDRKILECVAVHTTFADTSESRIATKRQIRVQCKFHQTDNWLQFSASKN